MSRSSACEGNGDHGALRNFRIGLASRELSCWCREMGPCVCDPTPAVESVPESGLVSPAEAA
jgi:hypothetical protein